MSVVIQAHVEVCEACRTYEKTADTTDSSTMFSGETKAKNPIIIIFKEFCIKVDHYSNFFEVDRLETMAPQPVIMKLQKYFV